MTYNQLIKCDRCGATTNVRGGGAGDVPDDWLEDDNHHLCPACRIKHEDFIFGKAAAKA